MGWGWAISWVKETNYGVGFVSFMGERDKLWGEATRATDLIPGLSAPPPLHKWRGGNWVGVGLEGVLSPEWGEIARQRGRIEPRMGRNSPTKRAY